MNEVNELSARGSRCVLHPEGIYDLFAEMGHICSDLKSLLTYPDGMKIARRYAENKPNVSHKEVTFLPVIPNPEKILCVGMNYAEKRVEFNAVEKDFVLFVRFADSQVGHLNAVCKPQESNEFDYEGELAVIIGAPYGTGNIAGLPQVRTGRKRVDLDQH